MDGTSPELTITVHVPNPYCTAATCKQYLEVPCKIDEQGRIIMDIFGIEY